MKATDLRIGNLVKRYLGADEYKTIVLKSISDTGEFTYIDQDEKTLYLVRNNFKSIEPIEITEEWILKMGLISLKGDFIRFHQLRCFSIRKGSDLSYYYQHIKLKHVHQVQNLFFALTGEELTIK